MKNEKPANIDDLISILRREQDQQARRRVLLGMLFDLALVLLCGAAVVAIALLIS